MTEAISSQAPKKKLLLVSSSGGHLKHLTATSAAWQNYDRVWVSFKQPDVESSLADERPIGLITRPLEILRTLFVICSWHFVFFRRNVRMRLFLRVRVLLFLSLLRLNFLA